LRLLVYQRLFSCADPGLGGEFQRLGLGVLEAM
jgi:hypothetical protein